MPEKGYSPNIPSFKSLFDSDKTNDDLLHDIELLRNDINLLRQELKPASTLIATGLSVIDEFNKLKGGK